MSLFHAKVRSVGMGKTLIGILLALLMLVLLVLGVRSAAERSQTEGIRVLENNLRRAAIQCYALEGVYPPSIAYLEQSMGVSVDHEQYNVFFEGIASNMMPQITVTAKQ